MSFNGHIVRKFDSLFPKLCQCLYRWICSDTGRHSGVIAQIIAVAPDCKSTHCIINRENLDIKKMSPEFNSIFIEVVKNVNHVTTNAHNSRLFAALCEYVGSENKQLILHADIRWLSRARSLYSSKKTALIRTISKFGMGCKANVHGGYI